MRRLAGCKRAGSWPEQKGHLGSRRSRRFKKLSQHRCCPELGDGVKFLEGRCESIRQAPHRSGLEFLVLGVEIHLVDSACQMSLGVPCGKDGSISETRARRLSILSWRLHPSEQKHDPRATGFPEIAWLFEKVQFLPKQLNSWDTKCLEN
jgi:hypothetical protein